MVNVTDYFANGNIFAAEGDTPDHSVYFHLLPVHPLVYLFCATMDSEIRVSETNSTNGWQPLMIGDWDWGLWWAKKRPEQTRFIKIIRKPINQL